MTGAARLFFTLAIAYAIGGMIIGLHMSISENHTEMPTHAHTMAAGWLMSAVFAFFYLLFPAINVSKLARAHFWLQGVSGVVLVVSLFFLLGGNEAAGAITGIASFGFFGGMLFFAYIALPAIWKA
jgi:hypothetical protein